MKLNVDKCYKTKKNGKLRKSIYKLLLCLRYLYSTQNYSLLLLKTYKDRI